MKIDKVHYFSYQTVALQQMYEPLHLQVVSVYGILLGCTHSYYCLRHTFAVTVVVVGSKPVRSRDLKLQGLVSV